MAELFGVDDFPADEPIRDDLRGVDGTSDGGARRLEDLADARVERGGGRGMGAHRKQREGGGGAIMQASRCAARRYCCHGWLAR